MDEPLPSPRSERLAPSSTRSAAGLPIRRTQTHQGRAADSFRQSLSQQSHQTFSSYSASASPSHFRQSFTGLSELFTRRSRPQSLAPDLQKVTRSATTSTADVAEYVETKRIAKGKGYDAEFKEEYLQGEAGNGVRVWYNNFTTIDWIHDLIKESLRMRKLRRIRGIEGRLINFWDWFSDWILVTAVALATAIIAFLIVRSEMWLFDLKEGYCTTNPFLAKRFCCRDLIPTSASASGFMQSWAVDHGDADAKCDEWREWSQVFKGAKGSDIDAENTLVDFLSYLVIAVSFAALSSLMTIYLSSSESVSSSKDSSSIAFSTSSQPLVDSDPHERAPSERTILASSSNTKSYGSLPTPPPPPPHQHVQQGPKRKVMYFAAGSGIPEIKTILSGFVIRGYLGSWTLFTKSVGLALSVASGLSLGKEGPFVHIASCVGNIISRFSRKYNTNEAKRRELLSASCAAGVAVAFGAPVGGTLFSLEEVSYYFPPKVMWRSFFCAMIAAVTLKFLDPFGTGKIVLFQVTYDRDWHFVEMFGFLMLGLFGGLYGALFSKANIWWSRNIRMGTSLKLHPIWEVCLVTALTALLSYFNPFTKMGGTEVVFELFSECHNRDSFDGLCIREHSAVWQLVGKISMALLIKGLLTIITFGIKLPAGIFIPTLAVGACAGRIAGLVVEWAFWANPTSPLFGFCRTNLNDDSVFGQSCVIPGVWAMVGAAGSLAGVTRTTVSLAVIVMELTGSVTYVAPVMLAILVAKSVADVIEPRGIYDLVIELADLPYLDAKEEHTHILTLIDVADTEAPFISTDDENSVATLSAKLSQMVNEGKGGGFPILRSVGHNYRMYGYINTTELEHGLALAQSDETEVKCCFNNMEDDAYSVSRKSECDELDLGYLVDFAPITISIKTPMEVVHELFVKLGIRYLIVVDEIGYYLGVVEKNRWLAYLKWNEDQSEEVATTAV